MSGAAQNTTTVILNLFQDLLRPEPQAVREEEWMLKPVQHDDIVGITR